MHRQGPASVELITNVHVYSDTENLMLPMHCRSASQSSLPDLLGKPLSSSTCTQPSLDTFTADCDVLDSALEHVDAEHMSSGNEQDDKPRDGKKQASKTASVKEPIKEEAPGKERRVEEPEVASRAPAEGADSSTAGQAEARESRAEAEKIFESSGKPAHEAVEATVGQGAEPEKTATGSEASASEAVAAKHSSSDSNPEQVAAPAETQTETEVDPKRGTAGKEREVTHPPKSGATAPDPDDESRGAVCESKGEGHQQHSGPGKSEAAAAGSRETQGAEAEEHGRAAAPGSSEQKAVMERGGSLMEEADQHDPRGIRLVRRMQVSRACAEARHAGISRAPHAHHLLQPTQTRYALPTDCEAAITCLSDGTGEDCAVHSEHGGSHIP